MTMTTKDFLQFVQERNGLVAPVGTPGKTTIININLQHIKAARLPDYMIELYENCGCIKLGTGYIFGTTAFSRDGKHPIPTIFEINNELTNIQKLRGKTIFGRNDLFWFAFDVFGKCYMLDNLELNILREYDDPYRAMMDCLIGGKF